MGDRANISIVESDGGNLYFYTHWDGTSLPQILADALKRGKDRWGDEAYLSRIIFSEMIKDDVLGLTGYGISTYRGDYNHSDLSVDLKNETVTDRNGEVLSFAEYCERYG